VLCRSLASTLVVAFLGLALASPGRAAPSFPLVIPRLGLYTTTAQSLDGGPWLYYRDRDTVAIAGHRTTHTRPFARLPELRRGDRIFLNGYRFVVRKTAVVRPWATWVLNYRGLVLSACTPAGSAAYRYVVFAEFKP
jgi:sortase (surface protein transpeptidase)